MIVFIRSIYRDGGDGECIPNPGHENATYPVRIDPESVQMVEHRGHHDDFRYVVGVIAEGPFVGRVVSAMVAVTGLNRDTWGSVPERPFELHHTERCKGYPDSHYVPIG